MLCEAKRKPSLSLTVLFLHRFFQGFVFSILALLQSEVLKTPGPFLLLNKAALSIFFLQNTIHPALGLQETLALSFFRKSQAGFQLQYQGFPRKPCNSLFQILLFECL